MDVDSTVLRWFQQVADGTTVTEVSDLEGISQPGLSRALGRLEVEVGSSLLVRSGRVLRMTRAGAAFKPYVDRALHELDDGIAAVSALASPDTGQVSLAYERSLGTWLVPRLIADFRGVYPLVRFDLEPILDERLTLGLPAATDFEITTASRRSRTSSGVGSSSSRSRSPSGPATGWSTPSDVELREVADEPFVMLRPTYALRATCDELCRAAGFEPTVVLEADDPRRRWPASCRPASASRSSLRADTSWRRTTARIRWQCAGSRCGTGGVPRRRRRLVGRASAAALGRQLP